MALFQELPVAFPFYTAKERQVRFNVNTDEPCGSSLITPKDTVLPFQIRKTSSSEYPTLAEIRKASDDTLVATVSEFFNTSKFIANALNGYDYFTYQGLTPMYVNSVGGAPPAVLDLDPGEYYLKFGFPNGEFLWSETFLVPLERFAVGSPEDCPFVRFDWSDVKDIDPIHYHATEAIRFVNTVYLDSNIYNSEPEIEQEGIRNGDNKLLPTFQKVSIKYRIEALVPDFLKLALSIMPIHKNVTLTTENAKRTGTIENISVASKPEANGYFSEVTIKFEQDLAVIKRGCGDVITPSPCPALPVGWDLNFSIVPSITTMIVTADLPPGFHANIRAYYDGGLEYVRMNVPPSQLSGGYQVPFYDLASDTIDLEIATFNCVVAYTAPLSASMAYSPIATHLFWSIEHDADFIAAGGSLSSLEKAAVDTLVHDLYALELYPAIWAIWPFLGSIASSQKYNMRRPLNTNVDHRLTFPGGGISHTANGAVLAPTTPFPTPTIDTNFDILAIKGNTMSASMVLDIQAIGAGGIYDRGLCGVKESASKQFSMKFVGGSGTDFLGTAYGSGAGDLFAEPFGGSSQAADYILSRRAANSGTFYYNGFPDVPNTGTQSGSVPAGNVHIGGINGDLGLGTVKGTIDFFALANGFTDQNASDMKDAIGDYKFNLGR